MSPGPGRTVTIDITEGRLSFPARAPTESWPMFSHRDRFDRGTAVTVRAGEPSLHGGESYDPRSRRRRPPGPVRAVRTGPADA